jgi:hypothetical protein
MARRSGIGYPALVDTQWNPMHLAQLQIAPGLVYNSGMSILAGGEHDGRQS